MSLFSKIEQTLRNNEVCILSKDKKPLYAVMKMEEYEALLRKINIPHITKHEIKQEKERGGGYDIDINKIPV